jgi:hypothetical protein
MYIEYKIHVQNTVRLLFFSSSNPPLLYTSSSPMSRLRVLPIALLIIAASFLGVGCSKKTVSHANAKPPSDAWSEYKAAKEGSGVTRTYTDKESGRSFTLDIPSDWTGDGPIWRPQGASTSTRIRVAYFPKPGPETEWSNEQKQTDVLTVVHAEKGTDQFVLLVNNKMLKASVLKIFSIDPTSPGMGFYLTECVAPYEINHAVIWSACKKASSSAVYKSQ